MTAPTDDTLTAIDRQLSVAYSPAVRESLPSELKDLVAQLVEFETSKRRSSAGSPEVLQFATAQFALDPSSINPAIG
jgi:hypothetical protein